MRRDFYIENDSGALSVVSASAVDAIIEDGRSDDARFVASHQVLLLELYGDDSMPVRAVVDEPLRPEEEAQWLARASARIDAPDGRLLVMGGFDPDVLSWWRDAGGGDARGVGVVQAAAGSWRVDVYAHAGSMNGREILYEADEPIGAFFRRTHPDAPFPVWLAKALQFSGEGDPGREELWKDVAGAVKSGTLRLDTDHPRAIGFLVHVTRLTGPEPPLPEGDWFGRDAGRRVPAVCPTGLATDVPDPDLDGFLDDVLGRKKAEPPLPIAARHVEIFEAWTGDPVKAIGGEVALPVADAHLVHFLQALASDAPPRFEVWVTAKGFAAPAPTAEVAVLQKGTTWAFGPPPNAGGWFLWKASEQLSATLASLPDGASLDYATAPRLEEDDEADPAVGRAVFGGTVRGGVWHIAEASPKVAPAILAEALAFLRELVHEHGITARDEEERRIVEEAAANTLFGDDRLVWEGDRARLAAHDERTLRMLAGPVFRARFSSHWPCDPVEGDEEGD